MTLVTRERHDGIEVVTIRRPEKRNALSGRVIRALHDVVTELQAETETAAVVLTGEGENFVAGADIEELKERGLPEVLASINGSLMQRWENLPMPTVAAIRGYALGGGCELALACDLRVAGSSAVLGQPEVGLGIIPGAGALYRLPNLVGMGRAKELVYTGRLVPAQEALAMGLVNAVVKDEAVMNEALALAQRMASQGRQAVRLAKLALNAQARGGDVGGPIERLAQGVLFESEEKHQRMADFLAKRSGKKKS